MIIKIAISHHQGQIISDILLTIFKYPLHKIKILLLQQSMIVLIIKMIILDIGRRNNLICAALYLKKDQKNKISIRNLRNMLRLLIRFKVLNNSLKIRAKWMNNWKDWNKIESVDLKQKKDSLISCKKSWIKMNRKHSERKTITNIIHQNSLNHHIMIASNMIN